MSKIKHCILNILKDSLVIVSFIIIYGIIVHFLMKTKDNDILIKLCLPFYPNINGWSFTHFLFFFI